MNHFDEMTCLLYLEGQLDRPRALEFSAHVDSCSDCRALLRSLEIESKRLAQALLEADEPVPARLLSPPSRERTPWGWVVTFGLASAGAYTVWTGLDQVRQQLGIAGFGEGNLFTTLLFSGALWKGWANMINFIEALALATLGLLAFGLWRRFARRSATIAVIIAGLALALCLPQGASAAEFQKSQSFTLSRNQTVHNDLIVMAADARIDGNVDGDLIIFGARATVNGHIGGDLIAFCQNLTINGQVDGNVRGFSSIFNLKSNVARNVSVFASILDIDSESKIGGGFIGFSNQVSFEGRIGRDVMAFGNAITLGGFVGGDFNVRGERLNVMSSAEIDGKAHFKGRQQPEVDSGAKLASPVQFELWDRGKTDYSQPRFYLHQAFFWGAAFLFGLVLILVAPQLFSKAVSATREYAFSLGIGFAAFVGVPILAAIVCVTIVGLGVGIATILLWLVSLYAAQTFISVWLGDLLLQPSTTTGGTIGRLALGLLIFRVVYAVPYLGGWIKFVVIFWGLGALAMALFRKKSAAGIPAPAPAI